MGTGSGSQTVQTQSKSSPWAPAQPALQSILGNIQGLQGQSGINPTEQQAIDRLTQASAGIPNFGPTVANTATNYLSGDPYGIINPAYSQVGASVKNLIDPNNLDPFKTPGFSNALGTLNQDITNQINGEFAGAGRSGSGMNTQTLARGLSQGEGGLLANQYNQNVSNLMSALQGYFGAAQGANSAMGQNTAQGANLASAVPQLAVQGPQTQLAAGQAPFNLLAGNQGILAGLTVPIAGLGGQTSGTQSGQTSYTQPFSQTFAQLMSPFKFSYGGG